MDPQENMVANIKPVWSPETDARAYCAWPSWPRTGRHHMPRSYQLRVFVRPGDDLFHWTLYVDARPGQESRVRAEGNNITAAGARENVEAALRRCLAEDVALEARLAEAFADATE